MLTLLKQVFSACAQWRQGLLSPEKGAFTVRAQKYIGPAETLRIVDVELDGAQCRLVLWNTKNSAQMMELSAGAPRSRGAAC